ncbi:MAG: two-component sensor histidine kinase [Planctomycetes bacterium]|nr:two-component sensor histidine kinase [Planctomycetota bacterium]
MSSNNTELGDRDGDLSLKRMGALAGALAHEIKNPLSTMNISLQLLMEDLETKPQIASSQVLPRIRLVCDEIRHLERILGSFLEIARAPILDLKDRDPNGLIQETLAFLAPECALKKVDIRNHCDGAIGAVEFDPDLFRQALLNLVRNALQAMEQGGTLTVITRSLDAAWEVEVIDTGKGIAPNVQERVFDPFFTTRKGGTGIGLAVTRSVIERHGGSIKLQSAQGLGTRFTLHLPRKVAQRAKP